MSSCTAEKRTTEKINGHKYIFKHGDMEGDYITVRKRSSRKTDLIFITTNRYLSGWGYYNAISKDWYASNGTYIGIEELIIDSTDFNFYTLINFIKPGNKFEKLSTEELQAFTIAFKKFPAFFREYHFNLDSVKNSLGWYPRNIN